MVQSALKNSCFPELNCLLAEVYLHLSYDCNDFTGIDLENIKKELPQKKKELDSKYNIDPQKSTIRIDDDTS